MKIEKRKCKSFNTDVISQTQLPRNYAPNGATPTKASFLFFIITFPANHPLFPKPKCHPF